MQDQLEASLGQHFKDSQGPWSKWSIHNLTFKFSKRVMDQRSPSEGLLGYVEGGVEVDTSLRFMQWYIQRKSGFKCTSSWSPGCSPYVSVCQKTSGVFVVPRNADLSVLWVFAWFWTPNLAEAMGKGRDCFQMTWVGRCILFWVFDIMPCSTGTGQPWIYCRKQLSIFKGNNRR